MERIGTPSVAIDLFGPGKHGFKEIDLNDLFATQCTERWFNPVQEELSALVEGTEQDLAAYDVDDPLTFQQAFLGLLKMFVQWSAVAGEDAFIVGTNIDYAVGGGSLTAAASAFDIVVLGRRLVITDAHLVKMAEDSQTFTATKDTWVSINPVGTLPALSFAEVEVGLADPGPPVGYVTIKRVRTDATEVTETEDVIDGIVQISKSFMFRQGLHAQSGAASFAAMLTSGPGQPGPLWVRADGDSVGAAATIAHSGSETALLALSGGFGHGVDASGGLTGARGTSLASDGHGLHGRSHASGIAGAAGVLAEGRNDASGLIVTAEDGVGAQFSSDGFYAPIRTMPRGQTTLALDGDMYYHETRDQYMVTQDGTRLAVHASKGGLAAGADTANFGTILPGALNWTTMALVQLVNEKEPQDATAFLHFLIGVTLAYTDPVAAFNMRVIDGNNVEIWTYTLPPKQGIGEEEPPFSSAFDVQVGNFVQTYRFQVNTGNGNPNPPYRDAYMLINGAY